MRTALERAESRLKTLEDSREALDRERQELRDKLHETSSRGAGLASSLNQVEGKLENLTVTHETMKEVFESTKEELKEKTENNVILERKLTAAEAKVEKLTDAVLIANRECEKLEKDKSTLLKEQKQLDRDLQGYRREEDEFRRREATLTAERNRYGDLKEANSRLQDEVDELQSQLLAKDHELRMKASSEETTKAGGELKRDETARRLRGRVKEQDRTIRELKEEVMGLRKDNASTEVMKQMLRSTSKELAERNKTIKSMKALQSAKSKAKAVSALKNRLKLGMAAGR